MKEWFYQLLHHDTILLDRLVAIILKRVFHSLFGSWMIHLHLEYLRQEFLCDEMECLEPIIHPTIGVFTKLGEAHQENFSSMQQKCKESLNCLSIAR